MKNFNTHFRHVHMGSRYLSLDEFPKCPRFGWFSDRFKSVLSDNNTRYVLTIFAALSTNHSMSLGEISLKTKLSLDNVNKSLQTLETWTLVEVSPITNKYQLVSHIRDSCIWQWTPLVFDNNHSPVERGLYEYKDDVELLHVLLEDVRRRCDVMGSSGNNEQFSITISNQYRSSRDNNESLNIAKITSASMTSTMENPECEKSSVLETKYQDIQSKLKKLISIKNHIGSLNKHSQSELQRKEISKLEDSLTKNDISHIQSTLSDFVEEIFETIGTDYLLTSAKCPICCEFVVKPHVTTECGHLLCESCKDLLISSECSRKVKCPSCRVRTNITKLYI